jgi:PPK2 family polyphosphate:nucleotide phosphotransferase
MNRRHHAIRVAGRIALSLARWPTRVAPLYESDAHYRELLDDHLDELRALQDRLYADRRKSLLVIFQGMDASGKDSAIKHVMSGINPQGCRVYSFGPPSLEEARHDFLWRCMRHLPERGHMAVFNRSYYEEVLVTRVHPGLLDAQGIPPKGRGKAFWEERFRAIRGLERHLGREGTQVVKFFLHVSREKQRERLLERLDDPRKNWKFSAGDIGERALWPRYRQAYEECIRQTATRDAPWHLIPADDKKNARLMISGVLRGVLEGLRLAYPRLEAARKRRLPALRRQLLAG